jgi:hypothetical protein
MTEKSIHTISIDSSMSRRIAKLSISFDLLSEILGGQSFSGGYHITTNAPKDLKIIGFAQGNKLMCWAYCESDTFSPVNKIEDAPIIGAFTYTITLNPE